MNAYYNPSSTQLNHWQRHARLAFPDLCQTRAEDSHKGSHGTLGIVGGATGMSGAIVLAGSAALKTGCGKVWIGFLQAALPLPLLPQQPEIMLTTASELRQRNDISGWVVGCGLGIIVAAGEYLSTLLAHSVDVPLLLDADALNLLATHAEWQALLQQRHQPAILTPHPAEAARLLQCTTSDIQANRHQAVTQLASQYHSWVVLKGHRSLIASPAGQISQNTSGNPGLSTAGSGDVLSGIIGSLLVQGVPVKQAVAGGVWLHGAAADLLVASGIGPIGLSASELANAARWLRNQLSYREHPCTHRKHASDVYNA